MLPLLPFAAGLAVGAAAVGMLRSERARAGIEKAQQSLRNATNAGTAMMQRSTEAVRHHFAAESATAEPAVKAKPVRASRSKTAAKPAAKAAAPHRARKSAKTEGKA